MSARQDRAEVYRDAAGKWRWRFVRSNGRVMADSGQGYRRRWDCVMGLQHVTGGVYVAREIEDGEIAEDERIEVPYPGSVGPHTRLWIKEVQP